MLQFFSGISLKGWLQIAGVAALLGLAWSWHSRGATIDDLRTDLRDERKAHGETRASLKTVRYELGRQNAAIEDQRAATEQAQRDLAAAIEASSGTAEAIDRLVKSSRATPAGPVCDVSDAVKGVWK